MGKKATYVNNGGKKMEFSSPDERTDNKHNGVGFSYRSTKQDDFLFEIEPFDRGYMPRCGVRYVWEIQSVCLSMHWISYCSNHYRMHADAEIDQVFFSSG